MKPGRYPPRAPARGPRLANRRRAQMLGLTLTPEMGIEECIEEITVLQDHAGTTP